MSPRGVRPLALRAACLIVVGAVLLSRTARSQQDTSVTELLLQVVIANGPAQVLQGFERDSTALLPLRGLLDLAETRYVVERGGARVVVTIGSDRRRVTFDVEARRVIRWDSTREAGDREWYGHEGELYVAADVAAWGLGADARMSWSEMQLVLGGTDHLPAVQRIARDARRAALLQRPVAPPAATPIGVGWTLADGAVLDWYVSTSSNALWRAATAQLGLGLQFLGGDLQVSRRFQQAASADADTRWTWAAAWPERRWLRQARAGDVVGAGPDARSVRGLVVSNSPYLRPAAFGDDVLGGPLPLGWEAELYRSSQLLEYVVGDSSGRYRLDVPLNYGPNPVEVALYGPRGELVRRSRTFNVATDRLPARQLEYAIGGGECRTDPTCTHSGAADLRYGLSGRITVQGGAAFERREDLGSHVHPYGLLSVGLTRALSITLHGAARGLLRGRADFDPSSDLHVGVEHALYDTAATALYSGRSAGRSRTTANALWRPPVLAGSLYLQGSFSRQVAVANTSENALASANVTALGARFSLGARRTSLIAPSLGTSTQSGVEASAQTVLRGPGGLLRSTLVRAEFRTDCPGELTACPHEIVRVGGTIGRQIAGALRFELGVNWMKGWRRPSLEMTLTTALPSVRVVSQNVWSPDAAVGGTQTLEGSVLWDRRRGRLDFGNGRNIGRGGLAGTVFLDRNGDGWRNGDDQLLGDVVLRVGSRAVTTDSLGRFVVYDLVPFERTVVEIDSLTLQDPTWVPAETRMSISPSPNSFRRIELAVVLGGEVTGRVEWEGRGAGALGGLRVVFRSQRTGAETATTTFSDGAFYAMGLRPGQYWVFVSGEQLEELRGRSATVGVTLGSGQQLGGVVVTVEPVTR